MTQFKKSKGDCPRRGGLSFHIDWGIYHLFNRPINCIRRSMATVIKTTVLISAEGNHGQLIYFTSPLDLLIERELKSSLIDCRTSRQKQKLCATVARIVKAFKGEREFHTGLISCCFLCFQCGNHLWTITEARYSV